jgi:hypothetical protein
MNLRLFFEITAQPNINLLVNGQLIDSQIDWNPDDHGNICVSADINITGKSVLSVHITQMPQGSKINLVEVIADDVRFGLITFLITTISGAQQTQLNTDGVIDIEIESPVWMFWCERFNSFNYKDYPLGSFN